MRDTAPLAEVGRAKAGAGTRSTCPRGRKREEACAFTGKLRPWRDATLSADRQTTQLADVAPSGPKPVKPRFVRSRLWGMGDLFDEVTEHAALVRAKARRDRRIQRLIDRLQRDE
jgi:hypothetical protein